jgi:alkylresorcinol/alkylpyrone synthase
MSIVAEFSPHIAGVASALPEHRLGRSTAIATLTSLFPEENPALIRRLVEHSGVDERYLVATPEQVMDRKSFTDRNLAYTSAAVELAARACRTALDRAHVRARDIDALIDVSCTGLCIPALDVPLASRLGLRPNVRRIPITESGCAAGALALGLAGSLARDGQRVLVVAVELCSLTLCQNDRSRANLVASVLFGDGAAAAVVRPEGPGPRIDASGSHLIPGTHAVMGFDIGEHGLRIILQRELPHVLRQHLPAAIARFLREQACPPEALGLHLLHPGGRRILEAYAELFHLDAPALRFSREALRRYGNLSSASLLTVLELALQADIRLATDQKALLLAIGPGLSLEMALLRWEPGP